MSSIFKYTSQSVTDAFPPDKTVDIEGHGREVYVYRNGKMVPKRFVTPLDRRSAPAVISDSLPDLRHPITGKRMDSKSQFRAVTRAHGCVEVGNDTLRDTRKITDFDTATRREDIRRAISELGGGSD